MANALHNIICLEAEWEYRNVKRNKFNLNTEPLLNWLRTFHGCGSHSGQFQQYAAYQLVVCQLVLRTNPDAVEDLIMDVPIQSLH